MNSAFIGKWKITEMELADEPGFVKFGDDGSGELECGAVYFRMDCGYGQTTTHFKFEGDVDGHEVFGEGWVELDENNVDIMTGSIEFWNGDESEFKARRM